MRRWMALTAILLLHGPLRAQDAEVEGFEKQKRLWEAEQAELTVWPSGEETPALDDFVRLRTTWTEDRKSMRTSLETSVRFLRHPETGQRLTLISTHHMSLASYFRGLEPCLEHADLVLCEGALAGKERSFEESPPLLRYVARSQMAIERCLGLVHESRWAGRVRDERWTTIDLPEARIGELVSEEKPSAQQIAFVETLERWASEENPSGEDLAERRRLIYREIFSGLRAPAPETPLGRLHRLRDEEIFRGVAETLAERKGAHVVALYGAWHTYQLEQRVSADLGFRHYGTAWHEALVYVRPRTD